MQARRPLGRFRSITIRTSSTTNSGTSYGFARSSRHTGPQYKEAAMGRLGFFGWRFSGPSSLTEKAQADIFLWAHQGICGRSEANEIIWDLLTDSALSKQYRDLSNQCSYKVGQARRYLDRPPATDLSWSQPDPWRWSRYEGPRNMNCSPTAVPINYKLVTGPGGTPLVPPALWQSVPLPAGPPPLKAREPPSPAGPPLPARPQTI